MRLVLIDGDNNLHRAFHKFSRFKDSEGNSTSMIYGFPAIVGSLIKILKPDEVLCAFDYGKHERRLELLPGYKDREGRTDRKDFNRQRKITQKIIRNLGIGYVREKGHEADDIIYWFIKKYKHIADEIIIVSRDKDFYQLISDQVIIYNPHDEVYYTDKDNRGLTPKQSLDFLILNGDSSDKIPGYPGVGEVTAMALLEEYGSIQSFLNSDGEIKRIDKEKLKTIYKRNKELIGIKTFFRRNLKDVEYKIHRRSVNVDVIEKIANKHNIKTFHNESFLRPFLDLENKYDE